MKLFYFIVAFIILSSELVVADTVKIDFTDKNLVEQGFVFEQLVNGHQCGCGESFTPVRDLKKSHS